MLVKPNAQTANQQSLHVNGGRNADEGVDDRNTNANSNAVPTFNVAGNASQAKLLEMDKVKYKEVLQQVLFKAVKQVQRQLQTAVLVQMLYQKPVCLMKELLLRQRCLH